jgi:hypothetical protein
MESRNTITNIIFSVTGLLFILMFMLGINLFRETASAFTLMNYKMDSLETTWNNAPDFYYSGSIYTSVSDVQTIADSLQSWQSSWDENGLISGYERFDTHYLI